MTFKIRFIISSEFLKYETENGESIIAIGTGGNINRLQRIMLNPKNKPILISKIEKITAALKAQPFKEMVEKYSLKPDRADVIIPAAEIYLRIMKLAGAKEIIVPKVGLSDGIILKVHEEYQKSLA